MLKKLKKIQAFDYFPCILQGHEGQPLNTVCLEASCNDRSLICIHCEEQKHQDHKTLPLKDYLRKVLLAAHQDLTKEPILSTAVDLYQQRSQFLSTLNQLKEKLVAEIDCIITQQELYFSSLRSKITQILEVDSTVDSLIKLHNIEAEDEEEQMRNTSAQGDRAKLKIKKLLEWCVMADTDEEVIQIGEQFKNATEDCSHRFETIKTTIKKSLDSLQKNCFRSVKEILEEEIQTITFTKKLGWSPSLKPPKFEIDGKKITKTTASSLERFALLDFNLNPYVKQKKKASWTIKITKLVGWIGIGVCFKNKITAGNFQFNYQALGHGSFLVSSNGYTWSSYIQSENSASKGYNFTSGDVITLQFDPVCWILRFFVHQPGKSISKKKIKPMKGSYKKQFSISLEPQPFGEEYYPCVNMCSIGEAIEIME